MRPPVRRVQGRRPPKSLAYRGTDEISSNPVMLGTTYRELGLIGVHRGTVTERSRPTRRAFHQPMSMRAHLGIVDAATHYEAGTWEWNSQVAKFLTASFGGRRGW